MPATGYVQRKGCAGGGIFIKYLSDLLKNLFILVHKIDKKG